MKNCDEMVSSLLERRERYVCEQKKKRRIVCGTAASLCCVCLTALFAVGVRNNGIFTSPTSLGKTSADAVYPGIKDTFDERNGEFPDSTASNNKIVINPMKNNPFDRAKMNICLTGDDFVEISLEEMLQYYGLNFVPDVPADIKPWEEEKYGIYKRDGGTGAVYWDAVILNYSNSDFTRNVNLEINNDRRVLRDYGFFDGTEQKSVINNIELLIGVTDSDFYYAEFMHKGAGFMINADGLTQKEFISVISSVLA